MSCPPDSWPSSTPRKRRRERRSIKRLERDIRMHRMGRLDQDFFFDFFFLVFFLVFFLAFGTFFPFLRASERPMAMACLRLFTVPPFPPLPLFSFPFFFRFTARLTSLRALLLYRAIRSPPL